MIAFREVARVEAVRRVDLLLGSVLKTSGEWFSGGSEGIFLVSVESAVREGAAGAAAAAEVLFLPREGIVVVESVAI